MVDQIEFIIFTKVVDFGGCGYVKLLEYLFAFERLHFHLYLIDRSIPFILLLI